MVLLNRVLQSEFVLFPRLVRYFGVTHVLNIPHRINDPTCYQDLGCVRRQFLIFQLCNDAETIQTTTKSQSKNSAGTEVKIKAHLVALLNLYNLCNTDMCIVQIMSKQECKCLNCYTN